ncbi:MAG: outer membrane beta-barrel protein, partial [Fulvivirga sp.]|nr:outer membrane beta-barrel protein [Fulvivirga sp.]
MSNISDNDIDKLFRSVASQNTPQFAEEDWVAMNARLDSIQSPSELAYFKTIGALIGGIMLIITLTILLNDIGMQVQPMTINKLEALYPIKANEIQKSQDDSKFTLDENEVVDHDVAYRSTEGQAPGLYLEQYEARKTQKMMYSSQQMPGYLDHISQEHEIEVPALTQVEFITRSKSSYTVTSERTKQSQSKFALKAVFAPDLSSVGYFSADAPAGQIGLLLERSINDRFFLVSGVMLGKKKYAAENLEESFYGSQYPIDELKASCRVLDIPVNIGYYIVRSPDNGLFVSAGFSTYIMLSEDYSFKTDYYG